MSLEDELDDFRLAVDALEDGGWKVVSDDREDFCAFRQDTTIRYSENRFCVPPGFCVIRETRDRGALIAAAYGYADTAFIEAFSKLDRMRSMAGRGVVIGDNSLVIDDRVFDLNVINND